MEFPYLTSNINGIGGHIKKEAGDFSVEEVPLYEPSGEGTHIYVLIEKTGISTFEAVRRIAGVLGIKDRNVGYAGLKDAKAVSRQRISIEHVKESSIEKLEVDGVRVIDISRHTNKLKPGHSAGNRFRILIRDADETKKDEASEILKTLKTRGVPNYFGPQRFGIDGENHERGRGILAGPKRGKTKKERLFVNAFQSYLFNLQIAGRIEQIDRLTAGDLAYIHTKGAVFKVDDPAVESGRCAAFEISPSGIMYGTRAPSAEGMQGALERSILTESGIDAGAWRRHSIRGERRPLRVGMEELDYGWNKEGFEISFRLGRGSYATAVTRELIKSDTCLD